MEKLKITDQDKQILRKSWNLLVDFSEEISVYHYESLFKYDPKVKLLFKRDMRNHGLILMDFFQTLMDQIENLSVVEPYLQRLGIRHKGYRVKKNNYYK
ncbi:MAG: hypothetical protein IH840_12175 [Candidatus Heimdallarchaeota archaeon]|nr:hypothetical protein [Candidatus Heimdallarchaeota archaeon]